MSTGQYGSSESFGSKMGDWLRHVLACCDRDDDGEDERPALQISGPTNFRREDISIAGLTEEQQHFIREKAATDAEKMWKDLSPLRSSPSGHSADRDNMPSHDAFVTPRSAPSPLIPTPYTIPAPTPTPRPLNASPLDRIKAHSRKISDSLSKPLGYQAVGPKEAGSPYEMRSLMGAESVGAAVVGKNSGESFSIAGSEEDRDSGKMMLGH